jgi:hypothetical protein
MDCTMPVDADYRMQVSQYREPVYVGVDAVSNTIALHCRGCLGQASQPSASDCTEYFSHHQTSR